MIYTYSKINILSVIMLAMLSGCIKQADINFRAPKPLFVAEGLLLTDSTPCQVTLSWSGIFTTYKGYDGNTTGYQTQNFIDDASVYLDNDMGDSAKLYWQGSGQYLSDNSFIAQAGHSYWLSIKLSSGARYASRPELIQPVQKNLSIDSIGETVPASYQNLFGLTISINTQDPGNGKNYYRWIGSDYLPRHASGIYCGSGSPPCFQYCWSLYQDTGMYILSNNYINGQQIRNQPVLTAPYFYYGAHYVEIKQLSLTQNAFEFWQSYVQQTTLTGSIFDPLPSSIQGNIYNVNDSTEATLGYFEASDAATLKFIIGPEFQNAYVTLQSTPNYVEQGACYLVYPNAVNDAPPGWENAPEYIVKVY